MGEKKPRNHETKRYNKDRPNMLGLGMSAAISSKLTGTHEETVKKLDEMKGDMEGVPVEKRKEHFYRMVMYYSSIGFPDNVIARRLECPVGTVRKVLGSDSIRAEVQALSDGLIQKEIQKIFTRILPEAIATTYGLMVDDEEKSAVRLDAAKHMMDRALGKPKETVENKTTILAEVFDAIKKNRDEAIEVEAQPIDELKGFYEEK